MSKRRTFNPEQKAKIVLELLSGEHTMAELSAKYDVHATQLQRWKKAFLENAGAAFDKKNSKESTQVKELEEKEEALLKKIGQLTVEVDWLKKNLESSKTPSQRASMVEFDLNAISIKRQCELLCVNRSRVYYRPKEKGPGNAFKYLIIGLIDKIHTDYPYYGSRRITKELNRMGHKVNRKRIQLYLREMGVVIFYPGPNLSKRNRKHKVYPYLLKNLKVDCRSQVWSIDITYISMPKGHMYLFAIIDWYTREIIDYELSNSLDTGFIIKCLKRAFKTHKPEIINSDQGSQFTSNEYIALLKNEDIKISMDSVGRATDNARIERFFRSIKQEKLYIYEYNTVNELRLLVAEYIEFYNYKRIHQALDYQTPYEFSMAA
ncbi:IS3 family transposase [Fusibacter sp. JL298sf-3]